MATASPTPPSTRCELCRAPANVLCPSDDACLCWRCDSVVHSANFLVARHRRAFLCRLCGSPTAFIRTGARLSPESHFCSRCYAGTMEACCSGSWSSNGECSVLSYCESEAGTMSDGAGGEAVRNSGGRRCKRVSEMSAAPACKRLLEDPYVAAQRDVSDAVSGIDDEASSADGDSASSYVQPAVGDAVGEDVVLTGRGCHDVPGPR